MKKLLSKALLGIVLLFTLFVSFKTYDYFKHDGIQDIEVTEEVKEVKEHKQGFKDKRKKSKDIVNSYRGKYSKEYLEEYEYNSQENLFDDESIVNL